MPTPLYHVSRNMRSVMREIDPARLRYHDENGAGFYVRPGDDSLNSAIGGIRLNGSARIIYRTDTPEQIDGSPGTDGRGRWIPMNQPVDQPMIDRLASALRDTEKKDGTGKFTTQADELEASWRKGRFRGENFNDLAKFTNLSGVSDEDVAKVFGKAGIAGSYARDGGVAVIFDPQAVPKPVPHEYYNNLNKDAETVGSLLNGLNKEKPLPEGSNRDVRIAIVEAAISTETKSPDAYAKLQSAHGMLQASGVQLSPAYQQQFRQAELVAARVSGVPAADVERKHRAEDQVMQRPARQNGEGLVDYQNRVYQWHDQTHPGLPEADKKEFNHRLNDTLYRESINYHAQKFQDPLESAAKIEARVAEAGHATGRRQSPDLNYFEDEMGRYHSQPGFKYAPESMKQAGKATIPGMVAAGAAAAITAVSMAAGGAQASEIKRAVIDQATPDAVKHIQKGEYGKAVAEVAGGALSTAFGAAVGGASAGAVFGLPGAIVGGVGGAVLGGLGLHDKAKKGFEVLIGEGKSYISGLFNGNAKGEMPAPAQTPDIPALVHQAQQQQNLLAPRR